MNIFILESPFTAVSAIDWTYKYIVEYSKNEATNPRPVQRNSNTD